MSDIRNRSCKISCGFQLPICFNEDAFHFDTKRNVVSIPDAVRVMIRVVFNPFKVNLAVMPHMLLSKPDHCAGKALKACTICVRYDIHDGAIRYQGIKPAQGHEFRLDLVGEHPELGIFRGMGVDREWAVRLQITQQSDGLGWVPYFQFIIGFSGSRGLAGTMAAGV